MSVRASEHTHSGTRTLGELPLPSTDSGDGGHEQNCGMSILELGRSGVRHRKFLMGFAQLGTNEIREQSCMDANELIKIFRNPNT